MTVSAAAITGNPGVTAQRSGNTVYTPAIVNAGTPTNVVVTWQIDGEDVIIEGRFTPSGGTGSIFIPLPFGSIDFSKRGSSFRVGDASCNTGSQTTCGVNSSLAATSFYVAAGTDFTTPATFGNVGANPIGFNVRIPLVSLSGSANVSQGAGLVTSTKPGLRNFETPQTALTVTSAQAGFAVVRAVGIAYADNNNVWRLKFNISAGITAASISSLVVTVSGVTFAAVHQAVANFFNGGSGAYWRSYAVLSTATITTDTLSAVTVGGVQLSGDVELASKPTWA